MILDPDPSSFILYSVDPPDQPTILPDHRTRCALGVDPSVAAPATTAASGEVGGVKERRNHRQPPNERADASHESRLGSNRRV